jgi:hypothetical protein
MRYACRKEFRLKRVLALEKHNADYFFPLVGREEDFDFEPELKPKGSG